MEGCLNPLCETTGVSEKAEKFRRRDDLVFSQVSRARSEARIHDLVCFYD